MTLDKTDQKILVELSKNARLSFRELSRKVGFSIGTVLTRVRRMENEKIIKGYSAILDQEKIGYELTAVVEIVVAKGKLLEMEEHIGRMPTTCAVYDVTGSTDAIIIAKFKNRDGLSNFTKTLLSMPFIERTNTHFVLTTLKEDFRLIVNNDS